MNCLIVDDNKIARATLKQLASQIKGLEVIGECADAMEAYNFLQDHPVDILLLDIEMPGMTGLELTRNLSDSKPLIIFTTSKKDYAVEAYELNVADYILKPVSPSRFVQAIERAREMLDSTQQDINVSGEEVLFIRDSNIVRRIQIEDILFAEAMGDYVKIYTDKKYYAVHATLKSVEQRLSPTQFIRVHRSYIVAVKKIDSLQDGVIVVGEKAIPVADTYRGTVNKRLNIL